MKRLALLMLFAGLACPARAALVLRIAKGGRVLAISNEPGRPWLAFDRVCVVREGRETRCGFIVKVSDRGAFVRLDAVDPAVAPGDLVRRQAKDPERQLAVSSRAGVEKTGDAMGSPNDFTAGLSLGPTFFFPLLDYQRAFTPHFALGVQPIYFHSSDGTNGVGALGAALNANYYGLDAFRGFWLQMAAGFYAFSGNIGGTDESGSGIGLSFVGGWRLRWVSGFNLGVGAGLQLITDPHLPSLNVRATGVQPLVVLDAGLCF